MRNNVPAGVVAFELKAKLASPTDDCNNSLARVVKFVYVCARCLWPKCFQDYSMLCICHVSIKEKG